MNILCLVTLTIVVLTESGDVEEGLLAGEEERIEKRRMGRTYSDCNPKNPYICVQETIPLAIWHHGLNKIFETESFFCESTEGKYDNGESIFKCCLARQYSPVVCKSKSDCHEDLDCIPIGSANHKQCCYAAS